MRFFTKTGDEGKTGLRFGCRVSKNSPAIEAIGCVDELNSLIGFARSKLPFGKPTELSSVLKRIQEGLLAIGADLASERKAESKLSDGEVEFLEATLDEVGSKLPLLNSFILPGGSEEASALQVCRAVCRRAERSVVALGREECKPIVVYLNRLSSLLFALALLANLEKGIKEEEWKT
jgi:cob(I)alamin adenosyltransferase